MSLKINLSETEEAELHQLVNLSPKPYIRTRARAILHIHEGKTGAWVAEHGLLTVYHPETISAWLHRYKARRARGLYIDDGRGRKKSFFPMEESQAKHELVSILRRSPEHYGHAKSRWQLSTLLETCKHIFKLSCNASLWNAMKNLGISYQTAREYIRSPDIFYDEKFSRIKQVIALRSPRVSSEKTVVLFQDEHTFTSYDSVAKAYSPQKEQPLAHLSHRPKKWRIIGAVNCYDGRVSHLLRQCVNDSAMVSFYKKIVADYPDTHIYIIEDNWPMHYHPEVLASLEPQIYQSLFKIPSTWSHLKASSKYVNLNLPIQIIPLPTYASWLNPIEKLWKWLKKDITHLHGTGSVYDLKPKVDSFLQQFSDGSTDLLKYMGLLKTNGIYAKSLKKAGFLI